MGLRYLQVDQLLKIFRLCGSPPDDYWRKMKLSPSFKPPKPYKATTAERFRDLPPSSLGLLATLLALDPAARGTAGQALQNSVRPLALSNQATSFTFTSWPAPVGSCCSLLTSASAIATAVLQHAAAAVRPLGAPRRVQGGGRGRREEVRTVDLKNQTSTFSEKALSLADGWSLILRAGRGERARRATGGRTASRKPRRRSSRRSTAGLLLRNRRRRSPCGGGRLTLPSV